MSQQRVQRHSKARVCPISMTAEKDKGPILTISPFGDTYGGLTAVAGQRTWDSRHGSKAERPTIPFHGVTQE